MAKTKEELNALKEEVETLNNKLKELTEEELEQVNGGQGIPSQEATTADIKVGDSVFTFDKNTIQRWGIVERISGSSALIPFGGGSMLYNGEITQLEPHTAWRDVFYLSGF